MRLNINTLKKLSGVLKVVSAIVGLSIIIKYDSLKNEDYVKIGKSYDWEKK